MVDQSIKVNSSAELDKLFSMYQCECEIEPGSYRKTRYIDSLAYDNLVKYELAFPLYTEIAKSCSMAFVKIMRSTQTNRFYIGFVNLGGHGPAYEIRPVQLSDVKNYEYMQKMFANYGEQLDWGVDLKENYKV